MPASRESFDLAVKHRLSQLQIRARYFAEAALLWPLLRSNDADARRNWLRLSVTLVRRWQGPSQTVALDYFDRAHRLDLGQDAPSSPRLTRMPDEQIVRTLISQGPGVVKRARLLGLDDLAAQDRGLAESLASGGRLVLDSGRSAIEESGKSTRTALGFMRVTDGDPCSFCAMLASRGAVYESEGTAGVDANTRFVGEGLFKFHNSCGCSIAPAFTRDEFVSDEASKFLAIWKEAAEGKSGNDARIAFRQAIEGR